MKIFKSTICAFAVAAFAFSAQAQNEGELVFNTFNSDSNLGVIFDTDGTTPLGNGAQAELWGAATNDRNTFTQLGNTENFFVASGNGTGAVFNGQNVVIAGTSPNDTFFVEVRAFRSSGQDSGATFAASGVRGVSSVMQLTLGGTPAGVPTPVTKPNPNTFANFQLNAVVVPEPSTVVLGVLGGLGLLFRRRRA